MRLSTRIVELKLRHTFTIARGSSNTSPVVVLELEHDGLVGRGEARPTSYYGESPDSVIEAIAEISPWLRDRDPRAFRQLLDEAAARLGSRRAALCALDLAVHDWVGQRLGAPLYRLLGADPGRLPPTSFTIGIDSVETMVEKIRLAATYPIIKVKLGTERDLEIVRAIRDETDAVLRVDANGGWTAQEAIEKSEALASLGVEFIEQPLPRGQLEAMEEVYARSALPLFADEDSVVPSDVPQLAGRFHGINIKLVKCGGILPAVRMVERARELDLSVMIGCMIESSLGITAAAHVGPLVDHLDLDGPLLITNDPYEGVGFASGALSLPAGAGLGVRPRPVATAGETEA